MGSTTNLMENYDEEFSVHQQNRSQGITLIAPRRSLCIVGDRRIAQGKFWKALRSNGDLFSTKFVVEPTVDMRISKGRICWDES